MQVTRCPQCHTAFRVVADQLRVRNGLVRCGACATVFDGRACLEAQAGVAGPAPASPVAPTVPPVAAEPAPPAVLRGRANRQEPGLGTMAVRAEDLDDTDAGPGSASDVEVQGDLDEAPDEDLHWRGQPARDSAEFRRNEPGLPQPDPGSTSSGVHDDGQASAVDTTVYGDTRTRYSSATDSGRAPPEFLDQDRIASRRLWRRVWAVLCLLGLLALAIQLVFVYRTDIALSSPALRPALTSACQAVGCTVGYARRIERISIVSSSLRPPAGAAAQGDGPARLVLTVVLRNRYDKDQHWPALLLDLTDLSDTVVARKAIAPEAYLPVGTSGPLAAGAEITLTVPIEVSGLQVNGYQLDKFFP